MTDCQHEDCTKEAFGTIKWATATEKVYCQTHLKQAAEELSAHIDGVETV